MKTPNIFRNVRRKIIKTISHNTKGRRPRFRKKIKSCFYKYSVSQDISKQDAKSQSTEGSVRKLAQPKRDSAFEQETPIVSCREISASSQNSFFSYNQRIKPSRAQKDMFGAYSTSSWKVGVFFRWNCPIFFERLIWKPSKQLHTKQNDKTTFLKISKAVLISFRYRKTSQTQDEESQRTERSVQKIAQPKRDSAFEQETRIVSSSEISASSQNSFFSYNQKMKPSRAQKDIFGTYSTSFEKVSVLLKKQKLFL